MNMIQKIKNYLLEPRFHFNRIQFNLVALLFISFGLITGVYIALSDVIPRIFALNDSAKVWTFNAASAGDYTASLTVVDNSGAHPTGGTTGANELANSGFASDTSSWSTAAAPSAG